MDKQTLVRRMQQCVGDRTGLINTRQVADFMGMHPNQMKGYLEGLDYLKFGHQRKYSIDDVAGRFMEMRTIG